MQRVQRLRVLRYFIYRINKIYSLLFNRLLMALCKRFERHKPAQIFFYDRPAIVRRISQILIVVVLAQSSKLFFGQVYFGSTAIKPLSFHLINLSIHLILFCSVLWCLTKGNLARATGLLLVGFFSYILTACYLWQYNLNLHYYFLLSMFVSCYLFDRHQKGLLSIAIVVQLAAFIISHIRLPSVYSLDTYYHANGVVVYLSHIAKVNALVFASACLLCALFIRGILAENWRQLQYYRELQKRLLAKMFPSEMMPTLLNSQCFNKTNHRHNKSTSALQSTPLHQTADSIVITPLTLGDYARSKHPKSDSRSTDAQRCFEMGVIFLDICNFTRLAKDLNRQECLSNNVENELHLITNIYALFARFDDALANIDAKRIKTNGDQYILLLGFNSQGQALSYIAEQTLQACLALRKASSLDVKIGAAFGNITCGVFDTNHPNFDIWGETVIRAARLEALASANTILIDKHLHSLSENNFKFSQKYSVNLKGLGTHDIYLLKANDT